MDDVLRKIIDKTISRMARIREKNNMRLEGYRRCNKCKEYFPEEFTRKYKYPKMNKNYRLCLNCYKEKCGGKS